MKSSLLFLSLILINQIYSSDLPEIKNLWPNYLYQFEYYEEGSYAFIYSSFPDYELELVVTTDKQHVSVSYAKFDSHPSDQDIYNAYFTDLNSEEKKDDKNPQYFATKTKVETGDSFYVVFKVETIGQNMEIYVKEEDSSSNLFLIFFMIVFFLLIFFVVVFVCLRKFFGFLRFTPQTTSMNIVAPVPQQMYAPPQVYATPVTPVAPVVPAQPTVYYPPTVQQPPMYIPPAQGY